MENIEDYPLPSGYSLRLFDPDSDDIHQWALIETAAGEFHTVNDGEQRFHKHYQTDKPENIELLRTRLYFLLNSENRPIGTATAWFGDFNNENQGVLDWVAIIPEYQGKKLAKPMVSAILKKIAQYTNKAYLNSQTTSWRAIKMYSDFGFLAYLDVDNSDQAWKALSQVCQRDFFASAEKKG